MKEREEVCSQEEGAEGPSQKEVQRLDLLLFCSVLHLDRPGDGSVLNECSMSFANEITAASGTALRSFFSLPGGGARKEPHRDRSKNSGLNPAPHRHGGAPSSLLARGKKGTSRSSELLRVESRPVPPRRGLMSKLSKNSEPPRADGQRP